MKIQIMSDLHLEFWSWKDRPDYNLKIHHEAEVLVLAGDCTNSERNVQSMFKEWLKTVHIPVVYVMGNHEYYCGNVLHAYEILKDELKELKHVYLLDDQVQEINGVLFIGSTLFTSLANPMDALLIQRGMSDFQYVSGMSTTWWHNKHLKGEASITQGLDLAREAGITKMVVVSHMTPSFQSCREEYKNDSLNCAYHNRFDELLLDDLGPDLWVHGHVHDSMDYKIGKTRVVCNPHGYLHHYPNQNFNPQLLIEV